MKRVFIMSISIYQKIISPLLTQFLGIKQGYGCRYSQSCSEFSKRAIQKYGIIKGLKLSALRILSCQPWVKRTKYGTTI